MVSKKRYGCRADSFSIFNLSSSFLGSGNPKEYSSAGTEMRTNDMLTGMNTNTVYSDHVAVYDLKNPLVSIITPCFNSASFLDQTIQSVMDQTYQNWDLIIIDDGSSDDSISIVSKYLSIDHRIHLLNNECRLGVSKTRNKGLDLCDGDYVALLDADDVWLPQKLEKQIRLAQQSHADIVYCSYRLVDEEDKPICPDFIVPVETDFNRMLTTSVISCSTALLSRRIAKEFRFPEGCNPEDCAYWMTLLQNGAKARGEPEILAEYRLHHGSRARNKGKVAKGRWNIYRKTLKMPLWKSTVAFCGYALNGLRKYRQMQVEE